MWMVSTYLTTMVNMRQKTSEFSHGRNNVFFGNFHLFSEKRKKNAEKMKKVPKF
jgi:hypothetical protein